MGEIIRNPVHFTQPRGSPSRIPHATRLWLSPAVLAACRMGSTSSRRQRHHEARAVSAHAVTRYARAARRRERDHTGPRRRWQSCGAAEPPACEHVHVGSPRGVRSLQTAASKSAPQLAAAARTIAILITRVSGARSTSGSHHRLRGRAADPAVEEDLAQARARRT